MKHQTVAVDTNLLLLLLVGSISRELALRHKRLRAFSLEDLDLLFVLLEGKTLLSTPNVLTEVSNLVVFGVFEPQRTNLLSALADLARRSAEVYCPSSKAVGRSEFIRLGLTDCAWLEACSDRVSLLTDDRQLHLDAQARGIDAYNFNHIRESNGLL